MPTIRAAARFPARPAAGLTCVAADERSMERGFAASYDRRSQLNVGVRSQHSSYGRRVTRFRRLAVCSAGVFILAIGACVHGAKPHSSAAAPRCYALSFGPWSGGASALEGYLPLPTRVALHDSLIMNDGSSGLRWAMRWPIDSVRRAASWEHIASIDSIAIHFPSWWSNGITVGLPAHGDTLRGRAFIYIDYRPFTPPRSSVTAIPIPCARDIGVLAPPVP